MSASKLSSTRKPRVVREINRRNHRMYRGNWSPGYSNLGTWRADPAPAQWKCWAQNGPTWSAHCGEPVSGTDTLGLCAKHREILFGAGR